MPFTPFHFGPGLLLHSVAPKRVSFVAFCAANVCIDFESLYNMVRGNFPVHTFFHTFVGAAIVWLSLTGLFVLLRREEPWLRQRLRVPKLELTVSQVNWGGGLGAITHVFFDAIMHSDARPFLPWSTHNPLLHVIPLDVLHLGCIGSGLIGLGLVVARR